MATIDPNDRQTIEQRLPFVEKTVEKRRRKWTLTTLAFDDVKQIIMIHVWKKYGTFDPAKAPFEHWLNAVISSQWKNVLRDNLFRWSRPCIRDGGCVYNVGNGGCGYTKSGTQCNECALYKEWSQKKEAEHNIKASLALEHHAQEVSNVQSDFVDIEGKKKVIDDKMRVELTQWERNIYRFIYVMHMTPLEATKELEKLARKRKRPLGANDAIDYQAVLKASKMMKQMILQIIEREDLI